MEPPPHPPERLLNGSYKRGDDEQPPSCSAIMGSRAVCGRSAGVSHSLSLRSGRSWTRGGVSGSLGAYYSKLRFEHVERPDAAVQIRRVCVAPPGPFRGHFWG